jgi:2-C-methyl-D-erythritol 4-phosphate cytidylyltransferase
VVIVAAGTRRACRRRGWAEAVSRIGGQPVLRHTLEAFPAIRPSIGVVVAIHPDDANFSKAACRAFRRIVVACPAAHAPGLDRLAMLALAGAAARCRSHP